MLLVDLLDVLLNGMDGRPTGGMREIRIKHLYLVLRERAPKLCAVGGAMRVGNILVF